MQNNLIYFKIVAKPDQPFIGYELQQAIAAAGFKFAAEDVLHYYAANENLITPLFSLTSAKEPKIFDLQNIGKWSCSGLMLFMKLEQNKDLKTILDLMLEIGTQLAEDLGGSLIDDKNKPITIDTHTRWHVKIDNFKAQAKNEDLFRT
jgi:cell division protein ZipA